MPLPMSIDILEILKSKKSLFAHFDLKAIIFPLDDENCPNFRMNIWFHIFCQIFAKLFTKNVKGGSDKYEIWHVRQ